jgi:hypothetical protein
MIFGRLSLEAIPYHEPILLVTFIVVAIGGIAVVGLITYFRLWGYLWNEWFTSVDHKKIGIMYVILALIMLLRGFADAIMMRIQQAIAFNGYEGYLPPHHYDQIFTAHGVIMIFFMAMPFVTGLMNYVVPLQIGARDVSFPFLNNFSFWMTTGGAVIIMMSLFVGEFARTGWLAYPPLSGIDYSPDVGVDYYIWGLQVAGVGTTLSGINLIATIVKMRAPGMSFMKMPVFTWTSLCTNVLIVATFPILTATLALLSLDRYVGTNFFTNDMGSPGSLYSCFASIRHFFRSGRDLLWQASFRLCIDGLRNLRHHDPVLYSVAPSLFHNGVRRLGQCVLRYHDNDHLHPYRGEDVQLAFHKVSRTYPLRSTHVMDDRLHGDIRDRRHDGCDACHSTGRLRTAQFALSHRAFP